MGNKTGSGQKAEEERKRSYRKMNKRRKKQKGY